jgi:aspartyl-tRNA synthetase
MSAAEEEADERLQTTGDLNALSTRSHTCGELADTDVGQRVRLCGWIQFQRMGKFAILRDSYGLTQIVLNDKNHQKVVSKLMPESVLEVMGRVVRRPDKDVNPALKTGAIEVVAEEVNVLNECRKDVPFIIRDYQKVNEKTRLEFRYIDLRHPKMQSILRLRSHVMNTMRQFLTQEYGFVEVETPTLFKATPGVCLTT